MRLWHFLSSINSSSGAGCPIFGCFFCLLPYFIYANSEGSGETAGMRRLTLDFAGRLCDKYHNLMSWLNYQFILINFRGCVALF